MNIKNYTSSVSVEDSVKDIEKLLVKAGATAISKFYDDGKLGGVLFQIPVNGIPAVFKLPAKPDAIRKVMESQIKRGRKDTLKRVQAQAERTAWRLLRDWIHVQLSMIEMEQAEAIQVFLPYVYDERKNETFFDKIKGGGYKQLPSSFV
jgi:hypothetical protein